MRLSLSTTALLVGLSFASSASADPADPDPWLGTDKALHFSLSAAIAGGGYAVGAFVFDDSYVGPVLLGSGLALSAGVAKESLDLAGFGNPSWKDLTWDLIGTAVGIGVSVAIHYALGGPKEPEPAQAAPQATQASLSWGRGLTLSF